MKRKLLPAGGFLLLLLLLLGELIGRYFGLTSYPLYQASEAYEYIHIPNQKVRIYGNKYETNEYSMRSHPLLDTDTTVVLLIGDSMVNGGNMTDQDSLASTLLENRLTDFYDRRVRVLNIAVGSWGPDNAAAYLNEKGIFGADMLVLVVSSDDAFDIMEHKPVVGVHFQYPDRQVAFAWQILLPKAWGRVKETLSLNPKPVPLSAAKPDSIPPFNPGFDAFRLLRDTTGLPMHLYLHAGLKELEAQKLTIGGELIVAFCRQNQIPYTLELATPLNQTHFSDKVHYTNKGQKFMADNLFPIIEEQLSKRLLPSLARRRSAAHLPEPPRS